MMIPLFVAIGAGLMTIHKAFPEKLPEWPAWASWTVAAIVWCL